MIIAKIKNYDATTKKYIGKRRSLTVTKNDIVLYMEECSRNLKGYKRSVSRAKPNRAFESNIKVISKNKQFLLKNINISKTENNTENNMVTSSLMIQTPFLKTLKKLLTRC